MSVPVYVINLDRSVERLRRVQESAAPFGLELRRVPAIDGRLTSADNEPVDITAFEQNNGRTMLPAELGCYLSHLKAMQMAEHAGDDIAMIVEDDVEFTPELMDFLQEVQTLSDWDLIKLTNHRTKLFRPIYTTAGAIEIGRCAHGPVGGASAYLVRRSSLSRLGTALKPMFLPYDVALERGWSMELNVFSVRPSLTSINGEASTITPQTDTYSATKFPFYRRLATLRFRTLEYVRRTLYALAPSNIRKTVE